MSISGRSGARGLQRLICLKYYDVLKQEIRFTLRLNAVKNTRYIKNCFELKLLMIVSLMKNIENIETKPFFHWNLVKFV